MNRSKPMGFQFDLSKPGAIYALGIALGSPQARFSSWGTEDQEFLTDCLAPVFPVAILGPLLQGEPEIARTVAAAAEELLEQVSREREPALLAARGYVDAVAEVSTRSAVPTLTLHHTGETARRWLADQLGLVDPKETRLSSVGALDALGRVYADAQPPYRPSHARTFREWSTAIAGVSKGTNSQSRILVQRVHPEAVLPKKERVSDSGYDLTLVYEAQRFGVVTLYGTGIVLEPPEGWYFDVVPRSSIIKRGYILANSVGIIDRSYRGEILVPLIKVDPSARDLDLPARVMQLIPRPVVTFDLIERQGLSSTERGARGFGSSGH